MRRLLATLFFVSCSLGLLAADSAEKKAAVEKQKSAIAAAIDKAGVKSVARAETDHLLVYTTLPEAKAKPLAEVSQKAFAFAAKSLKVEKPDDLFAGKLAVFLIPERKAYANLLVAIESKRPDAADTYEVRAKGDVPFVAMTVGLGDKSSDADLANAAAGWVAAGVLNKKLGTDPGAFDIPEWAQVGFAKIAALRAEGNSLKLAAYRTKAKSLVYGRLRGPVKISDAWSGSKGKESDMLAMSVVDYLAFGPDPEKFVSILNGFKKSTDNPNPAIATILAGLEWKWETLDVEWKTAVLKAK